MIDKLQSSRFIRWLILGVFFVVFAIAGIIILRDWEVLIAFPWRLHIGNLAMMVLFHSLALLVTFWVWHLMIARLGNFADIWTNFRFYYVSTLAKRIPTSLWYVGGRLVMYRQVGVVTSAVVNCIVLESVIIGIAGVCTFLALWPFYTNIPNTGVFPLALVGIVGIVSLMVRPQVFVDITNWILRRFGKQSLDYTPQRKDILLWGVWYILPWIFAGCAFYYAPRAFTDQITLGLVDAIGISTLTMLVALLSTLLPGGLGLKELTSSVLLMPWMPFSSALVISLSYRLLQTINEVLWALLAMQVRLKKGDLYVE